MKEREASVRDIRFDFKQTLTTPEGRRETSQGRAFFKIPGRFRIERSAVREQIFIRNKGKYWVYTPAYKQVLVSSWKEAGSGRPLPPGWLDLEGYAGRLERDYGLSLADSGQGPYVLTARPKSGGEEILKIWIEPEGFLPVRTELKSGPTAVETEISNTALNGGIEDGLFTFRAGPGIDAIRL